MPNPPLEVQSVLDEYPDSIRQPLIHLRKLIIDTAAEIEDLEPITETLKWGEPSFLCKSGSTIRIGPNKASPTAYALYVNCQTKLIRTFKKLYPEPFVFQDYRAIVFEASQKLPAEELKHCIKLSLQYHKLKNKPPFTKK